MLDKCFELYYKAKHGSLDLSNLRRTLFLAYSESPSYCMKTILLIRGNKSIENRRVLFVESLKLIHPLLVNDDEYWISLIRYIPLVGRWDDLLYSWVTSDSFKYRMNVGKYIKHVYNNDLKEVNKGKLPKSLLAKWMPTVTNGSSNKSRLSKLLLKTLEVDKDKYKKNLQLLRVKIDSIIDSYSSKVVIDEFLDIKTSEDLKSILNNYFRYEGDHEISS